MFTKHTVVYSGLFLVAIVCEIFQALDELFPVAIANNGLFVSWFG